MANSFELLDQTMLEMRWRCLSLAADLDRLERADGDPDALAHDPRLATIRAAIAALLQDGANRAERVQMLFSDQTCGPADT